MVQVHTELTAQCVWKLHYLDQDLLTCKNQQQKYNKTRAQCKIIVDISLALMKQFNLFPVASEWYQSYVMVSTYYIHIDKYHTLTI